MSVRMTEDEAWAMLDEAPTGILTTLRRDGRPVALPVWFLALDRRIYVVTRGRKVERLRHDPRCSFLVETGERWVDLRAVHVDCIAEELDLGDEPCPGITKGIAEKYAALRTKRADMPDDTRKHYEQAAGAFIELIPDGKLLTWDNRKLGVR